MSTPPQASTASFAAIFDWDGVIINSEECHRHSWELLAAQMNRALPAGYFEASFGRKNAEIIPELLGWASDPAEIDAISCRKEALYREVVKDRGMQALPGVLEWLRRLADAGIPCGIGSSTARANIELSLDLIGCAPFFRTIVSAEDVKLGKPHPEVFLTVAARLGMPAERCVVFEDALFGLEAARRAGMKCIAVTTTNPAEKLRALADRVVARLDELTVQDCLRFW